jgi:flagellar FliJ protein
MFRFRLQRVLELREKHEQAKALELAVAEDAAEQARRTRDELSRLQDESRAELHAAHDAQPRVGHLHQLNMVIDSLQERLQRAGESVVDAEQIAAAARGELEAAARDRQILDRLRDKHTNEWRLDEAQKDRQHMDEIALSRFARAKEEKTQAEGETA